MFFIIGITQGRKEFDFRQNILCRSCGRYGNYIVYMTYSVLTLFFIPCFKWNRQYFVQSSCCGATYRLDPQVGKCIARGDVVEIRPEDLEEMDAGGWAWAGSTPAASSDEFKGSDSGSVNIWTNAAKVCPNCGYEAEPDFEFCPKCGKKL